MEIKFTTCNGEGKNFNKSFWKNCENLKVLPYDETFESLKKEINEKYADVTYEKVKYYMNELRFEFYTVNKTKKAQRVLDYFKIDKNHNDFERYQEKQIKLSECIQLCAAKSVEWFNSVAIESFYGENKQQSDNDENGQYSDTFGRLQPYFWYKHKQHYKENPISLTLFMYEDCRFRVAIELHDSSAKKTHIKELFINKLNKVFEIVNNPMDYDFPDPDKLKGLKCVFPDEKDVAGKETDSMMVTELNKEIMKNNHKRVQFFFDNVEIGLAEENNINELIKKIKKEIEKLEGLYKMVSDTTIYEREIYKAVNASGIKQIIFNGAPGTGKTYGVKEYVEKVTEEDQEENKEKNKKRWKFIQFHPSYDYTDFVEGIRPISEEGKEDMSFVKIDGEFKGFCRTIVEERLEACKKIFSQFIEENTDDKKEIANRNMLNKILEIVEKKARNKKDDPLTEEENALLDCFNGTNFENGKLYYFIIDEINRADISKVFGELMYALEYRGIKNRIPTQYSQLNITYHREEEAKNYTPMNFDCFEDGFFIPENLVIIGTMNDIDKSVESFDFAMRRRFKWVAINAEEVMEYVLKGMFCKDTEEYGNNKGRIDSNIGNLIARINYMNKQIEVKGEKYGLTKDYQIGPSYFKNFEITCEDKNFDAAFEREFGLHVEPTLKEYIRGRANAKQVEEFVNECKKKNPGEKQSKKQTEEIVKQD